MTICLDGLFTSESVSDGHPDKICDQLSDAILDECLRQDPLSRVAVEVAIKDHLVAVLGEVTTTARLDIPAIIRGVLIDIGHADGFWGLDPDRLSIIQQLGVQSEDIDAGVSGPDNEIGAGDQGLMFGFACDETPTFMPLAISLAHDLMRQHRAVRHTPDGWTLAPDAKCQITVRYENGQPAAIDTIVFSSQQNLLGSQEAVEEAVLGLIIRRVIPDHLFSPDTKILINPTGRFEVGGSLADAGLTGRKIIVDTYGGAARHGGGAFSGKDATKVDRSAAYAARQIAKTLVERGWATHCEIQVSYAIGVAAPVSVVANTFGTGRVPDHELLDRAIADVRDLLRPKSIIERLQLREPGYRRVAAFGHFGRTDIDLTWERPLESVERCPYE
jgi:S-adenosylmethionine synthetase